MTLLKCIPPFNIAFMFQHSLYSVFEDVETETENGKDKEADDEVSTPASTDEPGKGKHK